MLRKTFICLFIAVLACHANAAVSASDAVNFVGEAHHYLYVGDSVEQPLVPVKYSDAAYWLVPVISGEQPAAYFAVKASAEELMADRSANRELFKAADTLREFLKEKGRFSKNAGAEWIVTAAYSKVFEKLGRFLGDETFELNTIASEMNDAAVDSDVESLNSQLAYMSSKCAEIGSAITDAVAVESAFTTQPNTAQTPELKKKYAAVFAMVYDLEDRALNYLDDLDRLKQKISTSALDASTKTYLLQLSNPPENFNNIGNYSLAALQLETAIESLYTRVSSRLDSLLDEFESRLEMDKAYELLYGESAYIKEKTGGSFFTLKAAVDSMLGSDNRQYWKNQGQVSSLEANWRKAEKFFSERNFSLAADYGGKARENASAVYSGGFVEREEKPLLTQELIFQIIGLLIILLVAIYLVSKREKIMGWLMPDGGGAREGESD